MKNSGTKPEVTWELDKFGGKFRWANHGACYSRVLYLDEAEARRFGEALRNSGATVNGGWFHGMPLGAVTKTEGGWEVMC